MPAILDAPALGDVVDRFGFPVVGWVWLGVDQEKIAAVQLWCGATLLGETDALLSRPDVCAALGLDAASRTGFQAIAHHPAAARGSEIELAVRVRFRNGTLSDSLCARSVRSFGFDEAPLAALVPTDDDIRARAFALEGLPLPPEHLQIRQVAGVWGRLFYREGHVILNQIRSAFDDAARPLSSATAILDFGCGCGRVLGAFADFPHSGDVWGCDIDAEAIAWSTANLGHLGRFYANPSLPPTCFANGQFDAIYSVSVFTHLPEELQFAWLTELRRILRPGGVLVASIHGGDYSSKADAGVRAEVATRGFAYRTGPITAGLPDFYMVAFHSEAYIRTKWTRFFELVRLRERLIHSAHDAVVMRRTPD